MYCARWCQEVVQSCFGASFARIRARVAWGLGVEGAEYVREYGTWAGCELVDETPILAWLAMFSCFSLVAPHTSINAKAGFI